MMLEHYSNQPSGGTKGTQDNNLVPILGMDLRRQPLPVAASKKPRELIRDGPNVY